MLIGVSYFEDPQGLLQDLTRLVYLCLSPFVTRIIAREYALDILNEGRRRRGLPTYESNTH